ncbi:MAG: biotin transporter BioY [Fusobacteriaceae bacterium]
MITSVKLENAIFNGAKKKIVEKILLVTLGVLFYAVVGRMQIPLPFTPVPISGGTLAVFLVAGILGSRLSTLASGAYLVAGVLGAPIFAGGASGYNAASFGYIIGYVAASYVMGIFASKGYSKNLAGLLLGLFLANVVLYAVGISWMGMVVGFDKPLLAWGLYPFIVGDIVKMAVAFSLIAPIKKYIYR